MTQRPLKETAKEFIELGSQQEEYDPIGPFNPPFLPIPNTQPLPREAHNTTTDKPFTSGAEEKEKKKSPRLRKRKKTHEAEKSIFFKADESKAEYLSLLSASANLLASMSSSQSIYNASTNPRGVFKITAPPLTSPPPLPSAALTSSSSQYYSIIQGHGYSMPTHISCTYSAPHSLTSSNLNYSPVPQLSTLETKNSKELKAIFLEVLKKNKISIYKKEKQQLLAIEQRPEHIDILIALINHTPALFSKVSFLFMILQVANTDNGPKKLRILRWHLPTFQQMGFSSFQIFNLICGKEGLEKTQFLLDNQDAIRSSHYFSKIFFIEMLQKEDGREKFIDLLSKINGDYRSWDEAARKASNGQNSSASFWHSQEPAHRQRDPSKLTQPEQPNLKTYSDEQAPIQKPL